MYASPSKYQSVACNFWKFTLFFCQFFFLTTETRPAENSKSSNNNGIFRCSSFCFTKVPVGFCSKVNFDLHSVFPNRIGNLIIWNDHNAICIVFSIFQKRTPSQAQCFCLGYLMLWGASSSSERFRLPEWVEESISLGQGSFRERSPVGSRFSESLFLDVPGTAMEQVRTCGFRRNSSSLDKAPKIRDSVRLNSFESLLLTLPSIQKPGRCILYQVCSVTDCSLYIQVFPSKLPLIFSYSSRLPWYWEKSSNSSEDWIEVLYL